MSEITTDRYNPNHYIKTTQSAVLAVFKLIEIAFAVWGIYWLATTGFSVGQLFNNFTGVLGSEADQFASGAGSFVRAQSTLFDIVNVISIIGLGLLILDSISVILLRLTGRFSGLVRFIHSLIWFAMLLSILLVIISYVLMLTSITESGVDFQTLSNAYLITYGAIALAGIGVTLGYHWNIASVMKTISIERRTGIKRTIKKNPLPRLCAWYAWLSAFPLILYGLNWVVTNLIPLPDNPAVSTILSIISLFNSVDSSYLLPSIGIGIYFIAKYTLVGACAKRYNREHE